MAQDLDGDSVQVIVPGTQHNYTITFTYHQVTNYDRLDSLAYAYYGSATLWWRIADANPEIMDWHHPSPGGAVGNGSGDLTAGTLIRIPNQA
jgi:phage tail protein X